MYKIYMHFKMDDGLGFTVIKGPFKYYVIKEVSGWGQIMAIFDYLKYCKSSKR